MHVLRTHTIGVCILYHEYKVCACMLVHRISLSLSLTLQKPIFQNFSQDKKCGAAQPRARALPPPKPLSNSYHSPSRSHSHHSPSFSLPLSLTSLSITLPHSLTHNTLHHSPTLFALTSLWRIASVACQPSMMGILQSIKMISYCRVLVILTAS